MNQKCYSLNDEDFNFSEAGDLFDALYGDGELTAGHVYYEADCHTPTTDNVLDVGSILQEADEKMHDRIGDIYDDEFSKASPDAQAELQALLNAWAEKHVRIDRYWIIDGKSRELRVTEEDVKDHGNG